MKYLTLLSVFISITTLYGQNTPLAFGGGEIEPLDVDHQCVSESERDSIWLDLQLKRTELMEEGKLTLSPSRDVIAFQWPLRQAEGFAPAYMIDQSHNVTDPIESLMASAVEIQRAFVQASLVDREALDAAQAESDVMMGHRLVKQAFITDVSPILAEARRRKGGAIDPVGLYRASGYRGFKAQERPMVEGTSAGIV